MKPVEKAAPPPPVASPDSKVSKGEAHPERTVFPANLAFFYPLATNMGGSPDIHTYFDLGLLYTRVGSVDGLQASAMAARVDGPVNGVQAAGIASYASRVQGLQASGIANYASQVEGLQSSGIPSGSSPKTYTGRSSRPSPASLAAT